MLTSSLCRRTVSKPFYDIIQGALPGLGDDIRYWAFTDYLLHTRFRDKVTGNVLIPCSVVKEIGGTPRAEPFLREYSRHVMPITWTPWSHIDGECRQLTHIAWPPQVVTALVAERAKTWKHDERVYFLTGLRLTPNRQTRDRQELERIAAVRMEKAKDAQRRLLAYLNDRSARLFTEMTERHYAEAHAMASQIEDDQQRWNAHMTLRAIRDQAKPFYRPSKKGNTVRIFGLNESILDLPRAIRRCLMQDCVELDLRSAQFAIAGMMWNIEPIQAFLQAGGYIWDELDTYFTGRISREQVKVAVYHIVNGGSKRECKRQLDDVASRTGGLFFRHSLIAALWKARQAAVAQIVKDRGARNCFSHWLPVEGTARKNNVPSIIAQLSQSYELLVMLPVLDLAEKHTQHFTITLWQHDGCSIKVRDSERKEYWINEIKKAVRDHALQLHIYTELAEE